MTKTRAVADATAGRSEKQVRVWDLFVRVFHWTVVVGFFVAYFTEDDLLTLHVWAGYVVGALIVLRILWGFVGPQHARFSDFVRPPGVVFGYLRDLMMLDGRRYLGHSPGGGAMVIALLIGLLATVGSGLVLYALEESAGPLAGVVAAAPVQPEGAPALDEAGEEDEADEYGEGAGENEEEGGEELWEEVHEVLADLMLVLVIVHVVGVLLASYVHHENLTHAMVTGRKRAPDV